MAVAAVVDDRRAPRGPSHDAVVAAREDKVGVARDGARVDGARWLRSVFAETAAPSRHRAVRDCSTASRDSRHS